MKANPYLRIIAMGVCAVLALIGIIGLGISIDRRLARDEWKPTGDGRTIVNTKTGELRLTTTGETVEEHMAKVTAESIERRRKENEYSQIAMKNRSDLIKKTREIESKNRHHFTKIQDAIVVIGDSDVPTSRSMWSYYIRPFESGEMPTDAHRNQFVMRLKKEMAAGKLRGAIWHSLISDLEKLDCRVGMSER